MRTLSTKETETIRKKAGVYAAIIIVATITFIALSVITGTTSHFFAFVVVCTVTFTFWIMIRTVIEAFMSEKILKNR